MKNKYDLLKVFAILLVVLGHITNHYETRFAQLVTWAIYIFHMPLFIAISGAVLKMGCDKGKYQEFMPFIANKIRRLMIPFVVTAVVLVAPTLVYCGESELGYFRTVVNIFEGGNCAKHLWFLLALFLMFVLAWGLVRIKMNSIVFFALTIITSITFNHIHVPFPNFGLSAAIQKFPFFVLGVIVVSSRRLRWKGAICQCVALCILSELVIKWGSIPILRDVAGVVLNISAVGACCLMGDIAWRYLKDSLILAYLSKQSFGIYLFHMIPIWFMRYLGLDSGMMWIIIPLTFVIALLFSLMMTHVVRLCHMQFIIGEGCVRNV